MKHGEFVTTIIFLCTSCNRLCNLHLKIPSKIWGTILRKKLNIKWLITAPMLFILVGCTNIEDSISQEEAKQLVQKSIEIILEHYPFYQ